MSAEKAHRMNNVSGFYVYLQTVGEISQSFGGNQPKLSLSQTKAFVEANESFGESKRKLW